MPVQGLTLDSGALIGIERGSPTVRALVEQAVRRGWQIDIVPGVVAQAWRGGTRQARLARFLQSPDVEVGMFDLPTARAVGEGCGRTGHSDVIDVHVAVHARLHGHAVVTSDGGDLRSVDPSLPLIEI